MPPTTPQQRKSTCISSLITATKWLPVLVTVTIFLWGWYAYTFQLVLYSIDSLVQQILCLVIFHIILVFSFWSYIQTILTHSSTIPSRFYLDSQVTEDLARAQRDQDKDEILAYYVKKNDLPVLCRTYSGGIRYCEKCNLVKPDRCHHCSICGTCVLRMDHHCPWINNCVSFSNYKFFVLFLGYTFALCLFVSTTTFPYTLGFWNLGQPYNKQANANSTDSYLPQDMLPSNATTMNNGRNSNNMVPFSVRFHILFLFFVSTMLSFGIVFLYCYHIHLLLRNQSTLEAFRAPLMTYGPDKNAFNLGKRENALQLFGRTKLLWLMPIFTTEGSGVIYDLRPHMGPGDEEVRQELLQHRDDSYLPPLQQVGQELLQHRNNPYLPPLQSANGNNDTEL